MHPLALAAYSPLPASRVSAITNDLATRPGQNGVPLWSTRDTTPSPTPKRSRFAASPRQRSTTATPRLQDPMMGQRRKALSTTGADPPPTNTTTSAPTPIHALIPTPDSPREETWKFIRVHPACCRQAFRLLCREDTYNYVDGALPPGYLKNHNNFARRRSQRPAFAALTHTPKELSAIELLDYFVHKKEQPSSHSPPNEDEEQEQCRSLNPHQEE